GHSRARGRVRLARKDSAASPSPASHPGSPEDRRGDDSRVRPMSDRLPGVGPHASAEDFERAADHLRDELVRTLEELERRRGRARALGYLLRKPRRPALLAGSVLLGAASAVGGLVAWRTRYRRRHAARLRWRGLRRAWLHPERVATRAREKPLGVELG